jgi:hypothetical protein
MTARYAWSRIAADTERSYRATIAAANGTAAPVRRRAKGGAR